MTKEADRVEANMRGLAEHHSVLGVAAGALCALIWGVQALVARLSVLDGLTAADVTVLRFAVAGFCLVPSSIRSRPFPVGQLGWRRALAFAGLAGAAYTLVVVAGVAFAPALHSAVITFGTVPLAASALAYAAFRERLTVGRLAALALIVAGLTVFAWPGLDIAGNTWRGYALFVVAGIMWATSSTLSKLWKIDSTTVTAAVSALSFTGVPIIYALLPMRLTQASFGAITLQAVYMGFVVSVLSLYLYTRAVALLGSFRASVFVTLVPIVTSAFSPAILAEWPTRLEMLGMAIVILGVAGSLRSARS